jgi:hypothetical protein
MERRKELRFEPGQPVLVDVLTEERVSTGRIVNLSGRGACIAIERNVPVGAALRIDLNDSMLLGEVCHCRPVGSEYHIGIELSQVIPSMTDLAKLVSAVMNESRSPRQESPAEAAAIENNAAR